ncbi:hypothetical protein SAY86_027416 [Trapa natans]|uniref:DUF6821 domain-containing protein n=1 Tax=Trapa natans TaxID=22666 RepID=A0AAN7KTT3_TRANT|nr:hypothetical protein SAY86_027416 [Trapa natans]
MRAPPSPDGDEVKKIAKLTADDAAIAEKIEAQDMVALAEGQAQDPAPSQASFKKTKEANEFAEMKMDSPQWCGEGIVPPMEDFLEEGEADVEKAMEVSYNSRINHEKEIIKKTDDASDRLNIWKFGLSGIGALCSVLLRLPLAVFSS